MITEISFNTVKVVVQKVFPFGVSVLLWLLSATIYCQSAGFRQLSMQEAVRIGVENHPVIKNQQLKIAIQQEETKPFPEFGKTEFNYRHGQLYSPEKGSYFEVVQNFGSPATMIAKNRFNEIGSSMEEKHLKVAKERLEIRIKQLYNQWIFAHHRFNLLEKEKLWYEDFRRIVDLHYEQGTFDLLQKTRAETEYALVRSRYLEAQDDILLAENALKQSLLLDDDLVPESEVLELYEMHKDTFSGVAAEVSWMEEKVEKSEANISLKKSKYFPELRAGYFYQSFGSAGFHGFTAGLAVPLWYLPEKSSVKKARLQNQMAVNELAHRQFETDKQREALVTQLNKYFKQIQYYKDHALRQAEVLIHTSETRYGKEDIDYFEHIRNLSLGLEMQMEYLQLINNYNEKAIELEYYVN